MNYKKIPNRLTGFSTPIFGLSWNPPTLEVDLARKLIIELEDRRVLYNPSEQEIPYHCVESVIQIRQILTKYLLDAEPSSNLHLSLQAMRASCRKFLDEVAQDENLVRFGNQLGHYASWHFNSAIGELRGVFGIHIAQISVQYGVDVNEPLSTIFPIEPENT